jgi:uncharacterized protein YjiS (DUF1127 family)
MTVASFATTARYGGAVRTRTRADAATPRTTRLAHPVRHLLRLARAAVIRPFRAAAQRRELAQLSERQLRDAGIDLSLAGRGKAVAIDSAALRRLQSLSFG